MPVLPPVSFEKPKRPLRPLHGIPDPAGRSQSGWILSSLFHGLILLSLLLPPLVARQLAEPDQQGAGGADRAGGGGGGTRGSGGQVNPERVRFLHFAAPASAPPPPPAATVQPTLTPPPPPPEPKPEAPVTPAPLAAQAAAAPAVTAAGTGGGTGNDGSVGNGPGSGGGVGSGVGTGRGSGVGAGTGGGRDEIFPPRVINFTILPLPVPSRVRPYKLIAQFEVDERGNARLLAFNPSRDSGYNRKIREMLSDIRFRPATRADGTAVKDTAYITYEAP